jgi:peptidoglycan/LPS O-acetylase OafA/YrhL
MRAMRLRVLIPVFVVLVVAALAGVLQAAGKDHVTTTEGVIFWLSLAALPFLLAAFLCLVGVGIWRAATSWTRSRAEPGQAAP